MEDQTPHRPTAFAPAIGNLALPDGVVLFAGGGIPSVFHRYESSDLDTGEHWLYLPDRVLEDIIESVPAEQRLGPVVASSFDLDDTGRIHPLVIGGRVRACLGDFRPSGSADSIDWPLVTGWLVHAELLHFHEASASVTLPPALVTCDSTPDRLVRTALNLLVEQVPEGLAATYDERDGLYRMRTAVGNIAMWDILEGELPHSTTSRWLEAIERQRWFLPAGFLPERPMLLAAAPDFLFVHPGVQSDRIRSLIAMPVPGNISRLASERALAAARMIADVHENRLGMTDDLLALCSRFDEAFRNHRPLNHLIKNLFDILHRRLRLSRLVLCIDGQPGRTVLKRIQEEPAVREDIEPAIAAAIRLATTPGRFLVPDTAAGGHLSESEAKRYYLDNVRSEFCFRLTNGDSPDMFVSFGSPEVGGDLRKGERLLEVTVNFLRLYHGYLRLAERESAAPRETADTSLKARQRLRTVADLADGHFHSMFDILSWMLGETELSGAGANDADTPGSLQTFTRAVERLVTHLDRVRHLLHDAPDSDRQSIPAHRLLAELPAAFEGYIHWLQDTRNIAVQVVAERPSGPSFGVSRGVAYDALYPVITAVMRAASHSGEVQIRAIRSDHGNALEISCARPLAGPAGLRSVLEQTTGKRPRPTPAGHLLFDCGELVWECTAETEAPQRARLILAGPDTDRNRPGRRVAPKTEVR